MQSSINAAVVQLSARHRYGRATLIIVAVAGLLSASLGLRPNRAEAAGSPCGPPVTSVIACENTLPGDPANDWRVSGSGDSTLQGFPTKMSVNAGQRIDFKISSSTAYHFDILRLGYYQGNGARKVASALTATVFPQSQPSCLTQSSTGLIDCGNWAVSASWAVPASAVSGYYIAHLYRNDNGNGSTIPFVVRNDGNHSDMVYEIDDETMQAYNTYGGNSLYQCTVVCPPGDPQGYKAAFAVSYNRPFHTPDDDAGRSWVYYAELPMVEFMEQNGYDVSYVASTDLDAGTANLSNHKVFVSSGHDEYWSGNQRNAVTAARDAGMSLAFFSGNEVFWKTRFAASIDASSTPQRTLVSYKETHFNAPTDPQDPTTWTGTWTDPRFSPPADGGIPPNALTGQQFVVNSGAGDIKVPAAYSKLRFWRNTAVATLGAGQTLTLDPGGNTLGYEWDEDTDNGYRPAGLIDMSSTTLASTEAFTDYGTSTKSGVPTTHNLTLYRAASGALVFGAGTVQWSWGLEPGTQSGTGVDRNMQQATVNLFADMGAQPATLISGLAAASASADATAPTSQITSPAAGADLTDGSTVTISGAATDTGGGVVAGVEVSTDGGTTWHPATGTAAWTYSWIVHGGPTTTIKTRATDDSGNTESPSAGNTVNVPCPCTIFGSSAAPTTADSGDRNSVEVGVKFTSETFGTITGVRFYKSTANTGTHVGDLWSSTGQLLASANFAGESASGWQSVSFATPVTVLPNTTYVASYLAPNGHYADDVNYFYGRPQVPNVAKPPVLDSKPLHAQRQTPTSANGVYTYSGSRAFPATADVGDNYWVDVSFVPQSAPATPTNVVATGGYASAALTWTPGAGGGPATAYTVTPYIGSAAQTPVVVTGAPAPTGATITGLTNGTTYTFTVIASNPAGTSGASAQSNGATPSANTSVVLNGGFEAGAPPWSPAGTATPLISATRAHSGTASALLGAVQPAPVAAGDSSYSQTVTVPPGTTTLSFWYWPQSADDICSGTACRYDWQEAQIRTTAGGTLASVFKSNSNAQAWTQVTFNTSAYAGQTIVLWFNAHNDGASNPSDDTDMYLDDVSLAGSGGPTAPAAPTGVTAVAGNATATVSWTAPGNGGSAITSYTVTPFIGATAQTPVVVNGTPPATTTTVTGLTNGTAYTFTVTATNAIGTGPPSAASNAVTPTAPTAPAAPTGVAAVAGDRTATVSWTAPGNGGSAITSYTVTPFIGATAQTPVVVNGTPPATTTTVTGLTNGTAYTFTVTATNTIGTGPPSAASSPVTPTGPTTPAAPTGVTAVAGNATATVSWTAPGNGGSAITSYTVTPFIGATAQTPVVVNGTPPATTTTVTGLTNGTAYTFTVTATNAIGTGPPSAASNAVTPTAPTAPAAPTGVAAVAGDRTATVSWTAPGNGGSPITSYTVTPFIGATAQTPVVVNGTPPATTTTVTGLTNGTAYTFTVTATNTIGTGPPSAASNAVTPTASAPPAFVQQTNAHTGSGASLNATPTANITTGNRLVVLVGVWANAGPTTRTVTDSAGNTYVELLHFTASDKTEMSVWTAPITKGGGTRPTITATPTSAGDIGVTVLEYSGLSQATDATAMDRSAQATGTTGTTATTVSSGPTPAVTATNELALGLYIDSGFSDTLTPGTGYTQRTNFSPAGDMEMLAEDQPTTQGATPNATTGTGRSTIWLMATIVLKSGFSPPPTAPAAPTGVAALPGNAQAIVSWTAPGNGGSPITSYTVTPFIGATAQTPVVVNGTPPATTTTVTGLTNGTAYTFTVTATNTIGTGPPSAASNAVTPTASAPPTFVQQTNAHTGSGASLNATPTANITTGNRLVVLVGVWANAGPTTRTVTDSAGNTYVELLHFTASDKTEMSVWTAPITKGGGTRPTITATPTSAGDIGVTVLEYSGLSQATDATAMDRSAQATGTTGTTATTVSSGPTPAVTATNELALGLYIDSGFSDTLTPGTGYTQRTNFSPAGDMEMLAEDQPTTQGATPNATTGTGRSTIWLMATIVLKAA